MPTKVPDFGRLARDMAGCNYPDTLPVLLEVDARLRRLLLGYAVLIGGCLAAVLVCVVFGYSSLEHWLAEGRDLSLLVACMTGASAAVCSWFAGRQVHDVLSIRRAAAEVRAVIDSMTSGDPTV
jgi:hypothetical protein